VDFVALSFVRSATDIHHVKTVISAAGFDTPVIAKIEKFEALEKLEEILHAADGAMVARGDLGVETAFECVPLEQKRIIAMCRRLGKPVITATQMLDSMIRNPRPTRAEVTDVANAVLDGTDAVMLSGETASGAYPLDAVRVMATIAQRTEASPLARGADPGHEEESVGHVLSRATCDIAQALQASLIIACTTSGATARWLSAFRPEVPILAVTHDERLVRRLCLSRGVFPVAVALSDTTDQLLTQARDAAIASGLARERDLAVIQAGIPPGSRGSTNMIKLDVLGHTFHRGIAAGPARTVTGRTVIEGGTAGPGDILVLRRLVDVPPAGLAGVITEEDTPSGVERLAAAAVPGVLAIPGACRLFGDGRSVTLDSARGLVYEG
jgi:pyruvate kinase